MSIYAINKICYRAHHDKPFREAVAQDPAVATAALPLSDEERAALLGGEVGRLFELGAHPFLLGHLARWRLFGLSDERYSERMRVARDPRDAAE